MDRFLEIGVCSADILESLAFYRALGFTELSTNDAWSHAYAAVSNGELTIGLHDRPLSNAVVTLTLPDLARTALQYADSPSLVRMNVDADAFNEVLLRDPDDHQLLLVEARTFSPAPVAGAGGLSGRLLEVSLPVRDAVASAQFWAPWSDASLGVIESPGLHMRLRLGSLPLALSENLAGRAPQIVYAVDDLAGLGVLLDRLGTPMRPCNIGIGDCLAELRSPEGLRFALMQRDFLD